jgi:hypothetical protein
MDHIPFTWGLISIYLTFLALTFHCERHTDEDLWQYNVENYMGTGTAIILPVSLSAVYRVKIKSAFHFPLTIWEKYRGQIPVSYYILLKAPVSTLINFSKSMQFPVPPKPAAQTA